MNIRDNMVRKVSKKVPVMYVRNRDKYTFPLEFCFYAFSSFLVEKRAFILFTQHFIQILK